MSSDIDLHQIIEFIKMQVSEEIEIEVSEIDENSRFVDLGLDSISGIFILDKVEQKYNLDLSPATMLDYPTIHKFSEFLVSEMNKR